MVLEGAVQVMVHRTRFIIAPGGMFLVPKGNTYNIRNVSYREVRIFFAQARHMPPAPMTDVVQDGRTTFAHGSANVHVETDANDDVESRQQLQSDNRPQQWEEAPPAAANNERFVPPLPAGPRDAGMRRTSSRTEPWLVPNNHPENESEDHSDDQEDDDEEDDDHSSDEDVVISSSSSEDDDESADMDASSDYDVSRDSRRKSGFL